MKTKKGFCIRRDVPKPVFFVASRGHHADIGGITPGSMPPHSTSLLQVWAYYHRNRSYHHISRELWVWELYFGRKALLSRASFWYVTVCFGRGNWRKRWWRRAIYRKVRGPEIYRTTLVTLKLRSQRITRYRLKCFALTPEYPDD